MACPNSVERHVCQYPAQLFQLQKEASAKDSKCSQKKADLELLTVSCDHPFLPKRTSQNEMVSQIHGDNRHFSFVHLAVFKTRNVETIERIHAHASS